MYAESGNTKTLSLIHVKKQFVHVSMYTITIKSLLLSEHKFTDYSLQFYILDTHITLKIRSKLLFFKLHE